MTTPTFSFINGDIEFSIEQSNPPWAVFKLSSAGSPDVVYPITTTTGSAKQRVPISSFPPNTFFVLKCADQSNMIQTFVEVGIINIKSVNVKAAFRNHEECIVHLDAENQGEQDVIFHHAQGEVVVRLDQQGIYKGHIIPQYVSYGRTPRVSVDMSVISVPKLVNQYFSFTVVINTPTPGGNYYVSNDLDQSLISYRGPILLQVQRDQTELVRGSRIKQTVSYRGHRLSSGLSTPLSFSFDEVPTVLITSDGVEAIFQKDAEPPNMTIVASSPKQTVTLTKINSKRWSVTETMKPGTFSFTIMLNDRFWTTNVVIPRKTLIPTLLVTRAYNGARATPPSESMFQLVGLGSDHSFTFKHDRRAITPKQDNIFVTPQPIQKLSIFDHLNQHVRDVEVTHSVRPAPILLSRSPTSLSVDENMHGEELSMYIDQDGNPVSPSNMSSFRSNTVSISTRSVHGVNSAPLNLSLGIASIACEYDGTKTVIRLQPSLSGVVLRMTGNGVSRTSSTLEFPGTLAPGTYHISSIQAPLFWTVRSAFLTVDKPSPPSQPATAAIMILALFLAGVM